MQFISEERENMLSSNDIVEVFNYAMAEWGDTSEPPTDVLERVVELSVEVRSRSDSNYFQCLSLTYALLREKSEALRMLKQAHGALSHSNVFSSWRYLRVTRREMLVDLEALNRFIVADAGIPAFIERSRRLI